MISRLATAYLGISFLAQAAFANCADDKVVVTGEWGRATFTVAVADSPQERSRGLMFVEHMPTLEGMLFVYEKPQTVSFWMKNTLIPLDMIFVGPTGVVRSIHENAVPGDLTAILGGDDILVVLEINGGLVDRLGIEEGDLLQHPAFGLDAVLPCSENS